MTMKNETESSFDLKWLVVIAMAVLILFEVYSDHHHPMPKVGANNNNTIYQIQGNTTAITTSGSGWNAVANATSETAGNYTLYFDNEGSSAGFYSFDGVHVAGRFPVSTAVTEVSVSFTGTWTLYVERDPTLSNNLSGLYIWGRYQYLANAMN
jgi:hypothetical protein